MDEDNFPIHSFLGSTKYLLSCLRNRYDNEKRFVKRSQFLQLMLSQILDDQNVSILFFKINYNAINNAITYAYPG